MKTYRKFAYYYDMLGWGNFSKLTYEMVSDFINANNLKVASIVDIACGTGTLAYRLARDGYEVWGIDLSPDMVRVAKAKKKRVEVTFRIADMRNARLGRKFDLVTCFFDSLNHCMAPQELTSSFQTAYAHLNPGGYFLFDMNTLAGLKNWFCDSITRKPNYTLIRSGFYDQESAIATVAIEAFVRKGQKLYERTYEVIPETAYPNSLIKKSLMRAGFKKVRILPFAEEYVGKEPPRIWVEAQR